MAKDDDKEWKFQTDKSSYLDYDILCEPTCLENEEKYGDNIIGNPLINLKRLTTNIEKLLVCQQCEQDNALQMKLEEGKYQEKFISYIETYYYLTTTNEKKVISQPCHNFNKQTSNRQRSSHEDYFSMNFSEHSNCLASAIV